MKEISFTTWDKWIVEGDLTALEFVKVFKKKYELNIISLALIKEKVIYCSVSQEEYICYENQKITDIYKEIFW